MRYKSVVVDVSSVYSTCNDDLRDSAGREAISGIDVVLCRTDGDQL